MSSAFEGLPKTPNLKLNKPGYDNVADIEALNENADILDGEIQGIKNTFVKSVNGINAGDDGNVDLGIMPIAKGGTGATNAGEACANLGAVQKVNNIAPDSNGNVNVASITPSEIVDLIYPVGSLYWSKKSTSPATLFGGTWTQIKDKFILAAGDSYAQGATGGAATVTLSTSQIPAHNHSAQIDSQGYHGHYIARSTTSTSKSELSGSNYMASHGANYSYENYVLQGQSLECNASLTNSSGSHSHTIDIRNTGGGEAHENMPPYVTYYCWERTA